MAAELEEWPQIRRYPRATAIDTAAPVCYTDTRAGAAQLQLPRQERAVSRAAELERLAEGVADILEDADGPDLSGETRQYLADAGRSLRAALFAELGDPDRLGRYRHSYRWGCCAHTASSPDREEIGS